MNRAKHAIGMTLFTGQAVGAVNIPPQSNMDFMEFQSRFFEAMMQLKGALADSVKKPEDIESLENLDHWRTIIRNAAQDAMLATSIPAEMKRLAETPHVPLLMYAMQQRMPFLTMAYILKLVHASAPSNCDTLPLYPFSAFFLEACDQMEMALASGKKREPQAKAEKKKKPQKKSGKKKDS